MAATQFEHGDQARLALRAIVAEHGPGVLSEPRVLGNLLADLLPDSPRIARIFVAAAQDKIADELKQHTSDGMDGATASRLAASSFAGATMFTPDACAWVAGEFALALGLTTEPEATALDLAVSMTAQVAAGHEPPVPPASTLPAPATEPDVSTINTEPHTPGPRTSVPHTPEPQTPERQTPERQTPEPDGSSSEPEEPDRPGEPNPRPIWVAIVTADRSYFDGVVAQGEVDVASIKFPADYQELSVQLAGPEMRIGRRSVARGLEPEIDLSGPPADPGISHQHAVLLASEDGSWSLVDRGSSNGTQVNGQEITAKVPVPLRDGDRIFLGAWTMLTIRRK
jgi:hypothetical protein